MGVLAITVLLLIVAAADYRRLADRAPLLLGITLFVLLATLLVAATRIRRLSPVAILRGEPE